MSADGEPRAEQKNRIAIIGAGPAGLFAAERLAQAGHAVTVYERMPSPARKFLMAGRGGLNLTHTEDFEAFLGRYHDPGGLIRGAVTAFPPSALIAWANDLGAKTFIGSSGRVFPKAMKASPLLRAWLARLDNLGVEIKLRHTWKGFDHDGAAVFEDAHGATKAVAADAVLLALGGGSWPRLGSNAAWVAILAEAGVKLTPLAAANCGVIVPWSEHMKKHAGSPLKRIAITCGRQTQKGEAIITDQGLEGGALYALSSHIREALQQGPCDLILDLKADVASEALRHALASARPKSTWTNLLRKAAGLNAAAAAIVREVGPVPRDPSELTVRIKQARLSVKGLAGIDRAISTAGGVAQSSLTGDFMLRALPGVFVAGEMLDFDAPTGGYLLQAAFATAAAAAAGIERWLESGRRPHAVPEDLTR